jgi:hypothetical protein
MCRDGTPEMQVKPPARALWMLLLETSWSASPSTSTKTTPSSKAFSSLSVTFSPENTRDKQVRNQVVVVVDSVTVVVMVMLLVVVVDSVGVEFVFVKVFVLVVVEVTVSLDVALDLVLWKVSLVDVLLLVPELVVSLVVLVMVIQESHKFGQDSRASWPRALSLSQSGDLPSQSDGSALPLHKVVVNVMVVVELVLDSVDELLVLEVVMVVRMQVLHTFGQLARAYGPNIWSA